MYRQGLDAAPEIFEALAQSLPGYPKMLFYPKGEGGDGRTCLPPIVWPVWRKAVLRRGYATGFDQGKGPGASRPTAKARTPRVLSAPQRSAYGS
jgi:hypothetical protein